MGVHEVMLLVMVLFFFCSSASFVQANSLVPENTHENMENNKINEKSSINGGDSGMVNQSKYTTGLTGGGHAVGNGGGQSNSSPQIGGNGVIPVYASGAAAQHRNHKGGVATYTPCLKGSFVVLIATYASILL